jgi:hypothetical protein
MAAVKRGKSKTRAWCEEAADAFGCDLKKVGKEWRVIQRSTEKVAYANASLDKVQDFLLRQIMKYIGQNTKIVSAKNVRKK